MIDKWLDYRWLFTNPVIFFFFFIPLSKPSALPKLKLGLKTTPGSTNGGGNSGSMKRFGSSSFVKDYEPVTTDGTNGPPASNRYSNSSPQETYDVPVGG